MTDGSKEEAGNRLVDRLREKTFDFSPVHLLLAVLDSADQAEEAIVDLLGGAFRQADVRTWLGVVGANVLDADGSKHGMVPRFWRAAQGFTGEQEMLDRYTDEILHGHVCVGVSCDSRDEALAAKTALDRHGAHFLNYHSGMTVETLEP